MLYILVGLFCLFFTATSYCNVIWPATLTDSLLLRYIPAETPQAYVYALFALLILILIPLEAYLYHGNLKGISYVRALCYAAVANATTLFAIFVGLILNEIHILSILNPLITYNITDFMGIYFIFLFIFTALAELIVMKLVTGCTFKKIIVPVLSGYALTIAILILAQLLFGLQK